MVSFAKYLKNCWLCACLSFYLGLILAYVMCQRQFQRLKTNQFDFFGMGQNFLTERLLDLIQPLISLREYIYFSLVIVMYLCVKTFFFPALCKKNSSFIFEWFSNCFLNANLWHVNLSLTRFSVIFSITSFCLVLPLEVSK